ncbi:MAG: hypothetical protein ACTSU9_16170 [Promethearchaeota archaeon]
MTKLGNLLEKPSNKALRIIFLVNLALFVVFMGVIFPQYFSQFPPGNGFMEMKNTWTKANMEDLINTWNLTSPDLLPLMMTIHVWDFVFMVNYGLLIASGIILVARGLKNSGKLQNFYLAIFHFAWIAVLLDVIEGINLFAIFLNPTNINGLNVFLANLSALLCLIFFYPGLILVVVGFIILALRNRKEKEA